MATPYGHSLTGIIVYLCFNRSILRDNWSKVGLYVFGANLPDLDFVPGILAGTPDKFHHGISHSIGFSIVFATVMMLFSIFNIFSSPLRVFIICFLLYFLHIFVDWLTYDTGAPYGLPFLWPFSHEDYIAKDTIFLAVWRHNLLSIGTIIHYIKVILVESAVFLPLILIIKFFIERGKRTNEKFNY